MSTAPTGRQEWAAAWPQPVIGMLGVVGASTFVYANSVFLGVLTETFHWTRTEFSSAFLFQMIVTLIVGPIVGRLVDRYGPRPIALVGCFTFVVGLSLISTISGSIWQWRLLCMLQGACIAPLSPTVWITAVSGRFNASRGIALATVLAGSGAASAIWPLIAVHYMTWLGWRGALLALAITPIAVVLPLTLFFFKGPVPVRRDGGHGARPKLSSAILTRTFLCILCAGALFTSLSLGMVLSLVPILTSNGFDLTTAAGLAGIVGLTTLLGRFVTGFALDRLPTRIVGVVSFLSPILASLFLWQGHGSLAFSIAGVAVLGFVTGAESDVLAYLASRRIERSIFASAYAIILAVYSASAATGPVLASVLYDRSHSYAPYLLLCIPMAVVSAILIWLIPRVASDHADAVPA